MSNIVLTHDQWRNKLRSDLEAVEKQASALKATDPTDHGQMETPSYNTEATRSNLNLPKNPTENTCQDKDGTHGLCTVTKPNAVGEGEYPTAIDGNARDAAFKTPSTPLSKIAGEVLNPTPAVSDSFEIPADLRQDASIMQKLAFCGNLVLQDEQGQRMVAEIMAKEAGRQEAQNILESVYADLQKEAAANYEAQLAAAQYAEMLQKQAAEDPGMLAAALQSMKGAGKSALDLAKGSTNIGGYDIPNWALGLGGSALLGGAGYGLNKLLSGNNAEEAAAAAPAVDEAALAAAMAEKSAAVHEAHCMATHAAILDALETEVEKRAYMQGAVDGAAADAAAMDPAVAAEMGGEIPANDSEITDEEVMAVIQELVESGQISPEQVDALMQQVASDEAPAYTAEQLAAELQAAVESGAIDQATAEAIAASILEDMQSGELPSEADAAAMDPAMDPAMAAPTEADQAMEVQASLNKTASILASLD